MTTLSVDGKAIGASPGQTLLECCRAHGVPIPTLCHLDGLSEVASCRLCLVEVKGFPRPVSACSTRAQEGMEVATATARLRAHRRGVVAMLLARGGHVCAFCPASERCELRRLARELGVDHHERLDDRPFPPIDASRPRFAFDAARCVLCTRCVRACAELEGAHALHLLGRGARTRLAVDGGAFGRSARCTDCGRCLAACPTGALLEKAPSASGPWAAAGAPSAASAETVPAPLLATGAGAGSRPVRLATAALGGCFGCHVSLLDLDERLLALAPRLELVFSPLADAKVYPEGVDVCLVEGAVATSLDDERLRRIRARTRVLVALGDCAASGNVTAMRDRIGGAEAVLRRAWTPAAAAPPGSPPEAPSPGWGARRELPDLRARVLPLHEVVRVDLFLPGCPPSADVLHRALSGLLGAGPADAHRRTAEGG